jgi:GNAT superfamily N-acetyltransferase
MGIEELKLGDMPKACKLIYKFHEESPVLKVYKPSSMKIFKLLMEQVVDMDKCAFVVKDGDRIVGIFLGTISEFRFCYDKVLQEILLYVEKDYRGKGLGLKLLRSWIKWGEQFNPTDVWINITSGMEHTRVENLFKKMDFKVIGTQWRRRK